MCISLSLFLSRSRSVSLYRSLHFVVQSSDGYYPWRSIQSQRLRFHLRRSLYLSDGFNTGQLIITATMFIRVNIHVTLKE